jgi:hypothetical protein
MTLSTTSPGDERAEYEQWLRSQHKARFWNTSDAMFAAWQAGRASSSTVQQVGADALDAARYRWLRSYPNNVNAAVYGPTGGLLRRDDYLDAAIDAAIASSPKSEQGDQQ